jgi:ankyrin repeat protein
VNRNNQYPLHIAASMASKNETFSADLEKLLEVCAEECPASLLALDKKDRSPLSIAISRQSNEASDILLKAVADATKSRPKPLAEFDVPNGGSPLFLALAAGLNELAVKLVEMRLVSASSLSSGSDGMSALHLAAAQGWFVVPFFHLIA